MGVSISARIRGVSESARRAPIVRERGKGRAPISKDCLAMPREASRPAKLPYMPSTPHQFSTARLERRRAHDAPGP